MIQIDQCATNSAVTVQVIKVQERNTSMEGRGVTWLTEGVVSLLENSCEGE